MAYTDDTDYGAGMPGGGLLGGSGGGWLGNLLNFSGGRSTTADLYGDLFTKKQLAAIQQRESQAQMAGLLGAINQFAAPSEFKKSWGQLLGTAGQAMLGAEGGDKAATTALGGQLTAQKIAQMKQEADLKRRFLEEQGPLADLIAGIMGRAPGAPAPAAAPPTPGAPAPNPAGNGPPPPQGTFGLPGGAPRPPAAWGLPPALPPDAQHTGLDPNQQFAGLLGGGTQLPPTVEAGLPPPDTVIPSGPGGLLNPGAIRTVGAGADDQWLARNAPFPTRADPQGDPVKWRHDRPVIDPSDPASQGPGSPAGGGLLTGSAWEATNNNLGGLRKPGVNASPSRGGFQSFATPEAGLQAISRQLDRYASGATTGKKLTTIREIVSTWAPPSENPTETLIARAAKIVGADPDQPLDLSDPLTKAKMITATISNEQGGRVPVDPELIASVASAPPGSVSGLDEVVGQRRGVPGFTRAQYSGGGSPGGGAAIPSGGLDSNKLQTLMLELARRNASAEVLGMGTPYGSLLGVLQGSPAYKAAIETATRDVGLQYIPKETTARKEAEEPFEIRAKYLDFMLGARKDGMIFNPATSEFSVDPSHKAITDLREEDKAQRTFEYNKKQRLFEEQITIEQEKRKDQREFETVTTMGPEGQMVEQSMTRADKVKQLQAQQMRPGDVRPGDIINKPTAPLAPNYEYRATPQGTFTPGAIPGTPAAREEAEFARKQQLQQQAKQLASDTVVSRVDRIEQLMQSANVPTTGPVGSLLAKWNVAEAGDIATMLTTIESNTALQAINQARQMSPTGAALGNTSDKDIEIFKTQIANVRQASSRSQFLYELREMKRQYLSLIHGPERAAELMATTPAGSPAGGGPSPAAPRERTYNPRTGQWSQ